MKIKVSAGSVPLVAEILEQGKIATLGQLRDFIADNSKLDREKMKILHRGKVLAEEDETSLDQFVFKENDKIIVMGGQVAATKDDPGFASLVAYENQQLTALNKTLDGLKHDFKELEKNMLDEVKQRDLAKRLDKRIKCFNESSMTHLMHIDGMTIIRDDTPSAQAQRNREKRKSMVSGIQQLLNENDALSRKLEEYFMKLDGQVVE